MIKYKMNEMFSKIIRGFFRNSHLQLGSRRFCCTNNFTWRTHSCGELNSSHAGQEVILCGWITFQRCDKFIVLRDTYGVTQIMFKENDNLSKKYLLSLPLDSVIQVKGIVQKRPPKDINKKLTTGEIEIEASDIKLLNASTPKLPISSKDYEKIIETTKYKYRYLSLRDPKIQENLKIRSKMVMKIREFLHEKHGFIDIETPTLFKRTPGGAKEFIVPTKFPGKFYSLVQSPQQFKQLLMVGGLDRYFQIARCYRNEGTKADRQPEFTQVDIEASFTTAKDIQKLVEQLLQYSWPAEKDPITVPFPCMTYEDAMYHYGTDKPDLRYEMKLQDLSEDFKDSGLHIAAQANVDSDYIISSIVIPRGAKRIKNSIMKELKKLAESQSLVFIPISVKDDYTWISSISKHVDEDFQKTINNKLNCSPEDLIILAAGKSLLTRTFLGKSRIRCAEYLKSAGFVLVKPDQFSFLWVIDFPLFIKNNEGILESAHHPFTAPCAEDADLIYSNPAAAKSLHYDLVLNGQEIGGGSIRIHDANLQKYIIEDILKEDSSNLQHLLDALSSGCPPHGGIALGMDRILAILCGCDSITDVIAFPKSLDGKDLMSGAPCSITSEEKVLYHIEPVLKMQ